MEIGSSGGCVDFTEICVGSTRETFEAG